MARVFAYLMQSDIKMTDSAIFADTSATIEDARKNLILLTAAKQILPKLHLKSH